MDEVLALVEQTLEFRYDSGGVTPIERPHTTNWRVLPTLLTAQIVGGSSRFTFDQRRSFRLHDGETGVVPAGIHHRGDLMSPSATSRWSHVDLRVFGGAVDALTLVDPPSIIRGDAAQRIGDINQALAAIANAPVGIAEAVRRKALGFELFALIASLSSRAPAALARTHAIARLRPALALAEGESGRGAPIPALARAAGVSSSRLHALFHAALGLSPLQYVLRQRLRRSQQLLIGSDLAIQEVAERSGFGDPFHFSRTFRKTFGESPRTYRQRGNRAGL